MQQRHCFSTLPEDCLAVICEFASVSDCLYRFKLRVTLSLVNRVARQLYLDGWLQPLVPRLRLFDALKPIAVACPSITLHTATFCKMPAFRIATFNELYYETMRRCLPQLVNMESFLAQYRYRPVGKKEDGIQMRSSDYNKIKRTLDRINKCKKSLTPNESLCFFIDLEKYASTSTKIYDIVISDAINTTPLQQLYLYVDRDKSMAKPLHKHWSKKDLNRMVPLRDALNDGRTGTRLFNVSQFHLVRGSLADHWRERVSKMKLLKRPLKLLAKSVKRRVK